MTPKKSYSRFFIILQEDEKGYSLDQDKAPSGYAKLEMKNNKCKLSYYVQNMNKQKGPCYMVLICDKKDTKKIMKIAKMNIDDYGRADVTYEYDMDNIANSGIGADKIAGAAIVKFDGSKITCAMHGFITSDVSKDWKEYEVISEEDMKPMPREVKFDEYEQQIEAAKENNIEESNIAQSNIEKSNIEESDIAQINIEESNIEENIATVKKDIENSELDEEMRKKKHKSDCECKEKDDHKKEEKKEYKKEEKKKEKKEEKMHECKDYEHDKHDDKEKKEHHKEKEHCDDHKMKKDCEHMKKDHDHEMKKDCDYMEKEYEYMNKHYDYKIKKDCDYMEKEYEYMKEDCDHMKKDHDHKMKKEYEYMKKDCDHMKEDHEHMNKHYDHMKKDYDHINKYYDHMKKDCDHMKKDYGYMNKEYDHEMKKHYEHMKEDYDHKMKHECYPYYEEHEKMYNKDDNYKKDMKNMMTKFFKDIVKEFEKMDKYDDIKNCVWYKVPVEKMEEMYCMHDYKKYTVIYYPMICYYPYIAKHKHFMIGHKYDSNGILKYIVYALPGKKSESDQPYGGKTGFVAWMPHRHDTEMGYWLMFYDFKNSTVVVPVKR
ncbi:hypothetical protein [Clostridium sp. UBA2485]|uniref:hypothetical protein n=1 Tax=Clostridium sp. UBA2485 TaxID=1946352 RepID=UPI0025BC1AD5|nr:hypothetical protein [Clostridium sp. UBA2485]